MRPTIFALLLAALILPSSVRGQEAPDLVAQGDEAAHASRHREAIVLYERAIASDAALGPELLAKLGRQYLWAGETERGVRHLAEYLEQREDCGVRLHHALGLSWGDRLDAARDAYRRVQQQCPDQVLEASLGEARVLRWNNRPDAAEAIYRRVVAAGTPEQRIQARIGLGYTMLASGRPRAAEAHFRALAQTGLTDPAVYEGQVLAALDLGLPSRAQEVIERADAAGIRSRELQRLAAAVRSGRRVATASEVRAFQESDGTFRTAAEISGSFPVASGGRGGLALRRSLLERGEVQLQGNELALHLDHRFGRGLALSGRTGLHSLERTESPLLTGELNLAWTPSDRRRVDVAAARIAVLDNLAAAQAGLTGTFVSVGLDERLTSSSTVSGAIDLTRWSEGNRRLRARASIRHQFPGVPQIAVEWPTLYQAYDEPFSFALWSPATYLETGPGISVDGRSGDYWYWSGYGRAGSQREDDMPWRALGTLRLSLERAVGDRWGVRGELGWSNSNLAGAAGYERTTLAVQVMRRW